MREIFFICMLVGMVLTATSLTVGLFIMGKGGEANIKYGNKFMRARVILQGITIGFFALTILTSA